MKRVAGGRWLVGILVFSMLLPGLLYQTAWADSLPESAYISGVRGHAQTYALSCESRSAADWAAFWGVAISETAFQSDLPRSDNPDEGFVGNANDPWGFVPPRGYGVHAEPVAALLREYGLHAEARRGLDWDDLREEIATGHPAIVWIIGQMWAGTPQSYTASNGHTTTVANFEHTMILTGYDASVVHVVDAYSGWSQTYPLSTFLSSWAVLGNMAVLGYGDPSPSGDPAQPAAGQDVYTVQSGDYLAALAGRFNVTWQELALLNEIHYPYTIYPGQVLKLPGSQGDEVPVDVVENPSVQPQEMRYRVHLPLVNTSGPPEQSVGTAAESELHDVRVETYTVQRGDYLIALAERFGVDWRELAALNGITYPFVIYPGQELRLR